MSTKQFLTICFVSINIVLFGSSCAQKISSNGANSSTSANEISCFIFPDSSNLRLRTTISIKDVQISGITIAKLKQDTVTGIFMNEFGIKSFSFQTSEGNCKILSILSKLDRWYIKRLLASDLAFIFMKANVPENRQFIIYNSTKFEYELNNSGKIAWAKRIPLASRSKEKEVTGVLRNSNDTIIFRNSKHNITYTFTPIK